MNSCISLSKLRSWSAAGHTTWLSLPISSDARTGDSGIVPSLLALLRKAKQPEGQLQAKEDDPFTFRWTTSLPRPCCAAQIWRPANPLHDRNGAYVTYDSSHAVFLKCLHLQYLRFGRRREFLGYLSPATITAAVVRSALITPPMERDQKRRSEVSPTTTKRPFTGSVVVLGQSLTSDVGPSGPAPASAAVGVRSDLSTFVLPISSNDDVMATTSNSAAVSGGSTVQMTLKQGLSRKPAER